MAPAPRSTTHAAAAASARATILVVDDSITTRTLEKGILEAAGYRVVVCVDGQDALDRLRAEIEPVNLVLADVEMPRLDGFGLLKALRADERFARLPAILMTSARGCRRRRPGPGSRRRRLPDQAEVRPAPAAGYDRAAPMTPVRVMLVEDSLVVRELLRHIVSRDPRLELVAAVASGEEALDKLRTVRPDVISMDSACRDRRAGDDPPDHGRAPDADRRGGGFGRG